MSATKDYLMTVENLIWEAIELGFKTEDEIYAYVFMYEDRINLDTVKILLEEIMVD